jgi:hypothetical protein
LIPNPQPNPLVADHNLASEKQNHHFVSTNVKVNDTYTEFHEPQPENCWLGTNY